jgi:hypothetical protein
MWFSAFSVARSRGPELVGIGLPSDDPMHTFRFSLVLAAFMADWGRSEGNIHHGMSIFVFWYYIKYIANIIT